MSVELREGASYSAGEGGSVDAPAIDREASMVAAAKRGDPSAFEELIARNERRIFRLAQTVTRSREDAEEVVQEAFLRAFLRLDTFHGESRFSTWLTRIAINQALMKLRKRRSNLVPLDDLIQTEDGSLPREIVDWGPTPEQRYAQQELREILNEAIAGLGPAYRAVFQLRDVEELSIEETSEALGISVSAVKSRLWRARLELRERLNRFFGTRRGLHGVSRNNRNRGNHTEAGEKRGVRHMRLQTTVPVRTLERFRGHISKLVADDARRNAWQNA